MVKMGYKQTDEHKRKLSISHKGRKFTDEHKLHLSQALKGRTLSEQTRLKMRNRKHTQEEIEKRRLKLIGRKHPPSFFEKVSGVKHYLWKGEEASYYAKHIFITKKRGKPQYCEICGTTNKDKKYNWANIDHNYTRDINDYFRLCVRCHNLFDRLFLGKFLRDK